MYDALGRRISKTDVTRNTTTRFVWNGNELLAETTAGAQLKRSYVQGLQTDEVLYQMDHIQNETFYFAQDYLMSTLALTAQDGSVAESFTYDAYGNLTSAPSRPSTNRLYAGREFDAEVGLYYNRARYYDPKQGRFISADPKGYAAGLNLYAYVLNNPNQFRDPQGTDPLWAGVGYYLPFPFIPENGDEEYTIDTLLGGGLNFTTDKSSSNSPRDIPGPGKEGFTMPFHEVFTSSSHTGCQTCGVSGSQSGGVQPTTGPATQNEVFQPGIDILGPGINDVGNQILKVMSVISPNWNDPGDFGSYFWAAVYESSDVSLTTVLLHRSFTFSRDGRKTGIDKNWFSLQIDVTNSRYVEGTEYSAGWGWISLGTKIYQGKWQGNYNLHFGVSFPPTIIGVNFPDEDRNPVPKNEK